MAIPFEHHSVVDPNGRKDAPAVHQPDLAGRNDRIRCVADFVVMKQKAVHDLILVRITVDCDSQATKNDGLRYWTNSLVNVLERSICELSTFSSDTPSTCFTI